MRSYRDEKASQLLLRFYRRKPIVPTCREQTDNGSEFAWEFETATAKLGIQRYFSRVKTPRDNPEIERFNETLEYEWLYNFNLSLDPEELNPRLTEWLIEYNFKRPHQSLAYLTPVEYIEKELAKIRCPVLPVWSASTNAGLFLCPVVYLKQEIKMRSSLIGKIEKAKRYAQEPDRVTFSGLTAVFHGENDDHKLSYANGKWHCTCLFFSQWEICSHIMALQQILGDMLPKEALASPMETQPPEK